MRPAVPFMPTRPLKPAGIRIDPPPSPPDAIATRPPATAAELPPDEPPAVFPCFQGLWQMPWRRLTLTLRPPNSEAKVRPTGFAPPCSTTRLIIVPVWVAVRSLKTSEASVAGHPSTESSSFTPNGTPPKGCETSAASARARAPSGSRNVKALRSLASMAASEASSSSTGERSPLRKASTSEQASPVQGVSGMEAEGRGVAS